jgi:hypothetical protein
MKLRTIAAAVTIAGAALTGTALAAHASAPVIFQAQVTGWNTFRAAYPLTVGEIVSENTGGRQFTITSVQSAGGDENVTVSTAGLPAKGTDVALTLVS